MSYLSFEFLVQFIASCAFCNHGNCRIVESRDDDVILRSPLPTYAKMKSTVNKNQVQDFSIGI